MEPFPDPGRLPVAQPSPARHPGAAAHLLRQHLPRDAALEHKQDAGQRRPVRDRWPAAFRLWPLRRQQRFDQGPQFIGYERLGHAAQNSPPVPPFPVSLGALSSTLAIFDPLIRGAWPVTRQRHCSRCRCRWQRDRSRGRSAGPGRRALDRRAAKPAYRARPPPSAHDRPAR